MIGKTLQGKVIRLAGRLPQIWDDPSTSVVRRKALLRCLIDNVILDRGEHDVTSVRIVCRGGAVISLDVKMRINSVSKLARDEEMRQRVRALACEGMYDDEIAAMLTPTCEDKGLPITVQRIRHAANIEVNQPRTRWTRSVGVLSASELATKLKISVNWLYAQSGSSD